MKRWKWDFRDVSVGLKMLREALLGRPHNLHGRFPPQLASRTIPPPNIPRGPEYKYSNQYYFNRSALNSVEPPVIAPIAEGPDLIRDPTKIAESGKGIRPETVCFLCSPTPGLPWWWDGHCYFECVEEQQTCPSPPQEGPPPCCDPCPPPPCPPC